MQEREAVIYVKGEQKMATVNIYDETTGRTYTITVDVNQAVINGLANGDEAYYISVSTSARDPLGQAIRTRVITDNDIDDESSDSEDYVDITTPVNNAIMDIMRDIEGGYLSSSISDSSLSSQSDSSQSESSQSESSQSESSQSESSQSQSSRSESSRSESSRSEQTSSEP